jgi:hypothetical protein
MVGEIPSFLGDFSLISAVLSCLPCGFSSELSSEAEQAAISPVSNAREGKSFGMTAAAQVTGQESYDVEESSAATGNLSGPGLHRTRATGDLRQEAAQSPSLPTVRRDSVLIPTQATVIEVRGDSQDWARIQLQGPPSLHCKEKTLEPGAVPPRGIRSLTPARIQLSSKQSQGQLGTAKLEKPEGLPKTKSIRQLDADQLDYLATEFAKKFNHFNQGNVGQVPANAFDLGLEYSTTLPFIDLCITDNTLPGQAVKFHSADFVPSSASVRIGDCQFFNLPIPIGSQTTNFDRLEPQDGGRAGNTARSTLTVVEETVGRVLRTEVGSDGRPRFVITFFGDLYSAESSTKANLGWASSIDLTDPVRRLAVAERFARQTLVMDGDFKAAYGSTQVRPVPGVARSTVFPDANEWFMDSKHENEHVRSETHRSSLAKGVSDDIALWNSISDDSIPESDEDAQMTDHVTKLLHLTTALRDMHSNVSVVTPSEDSTADFAHYTGYQVKFIGQTLQSAEFKSHSNLQRMSLNALHLLGSRLHENERQSIEMPCGGDERVRRLYCVPVTDGRKALVQKKWWAIFEVEVESKPMW